MPRVRSALLSVPVLAISLAGCFPSPRASSMGPPPPTVPKPTPTVPAVEEAGLAIGPPLRLDDAVLQDDKSVLEKLQDALADLKEARDTNKELSARLRVETQRTAAVDVEISDLRNQLSALTEQLKLKSEVAKKTQAELDAAKATIARLQPQLEQANKGASEAEKLAKMLKDATAENEKFRDQVLQAELARVKAQQDLVALQIVMARQQALLKRRAKPDEAKAPILPPASDQEATP